MAPPVVVLSKLPEEMFEIAKLVDVAPWRLVLPRTVSAPLALSAPPTLSNDVSVVELVTANVPVDVAPVVVNPPLNASCVEVALFGKR